MLNGTHATGKSTTAIAVAERFGSMFYVPSFVAKIAKTNHFDLNRPNISGSEVMAFQNKVMDAFLMSYEMTARMDTIYDRSPLDFACYLLASDNEIPCDLGREYIKRCIQLTEDFCDVLIYPESDLSITYESKFNRPNCTPKEQKKRAAYDERLRFFMDALDDKVKIIDVPMDCQYGDRVNFIEQELRKIL